MLLNAKRLLNPPDSHVTIAVVAANVLCLFCLSAWSYQRVDAECSDA